jgi:hypothetical protein
MQLERERLRVWVYDSLVRTHQELGLGSQPLSLNAISKWVKQKAQQSGFLPPDTVRRTTNLEKADEDAIRECVWGLVIQGIVVPGSSNDDTYQSNFPWMQVTEWGKVCLENGEYVPYDTGLFLSRIKNEIPNLDEIVVLYLKEALNSFRAGIYLAVAVMTGVASERILIVLRDAIGLAIKENDRHKKLVEATENQTAKRIYEEISKKIGPIRKQLPAGLQDSIGTELEGIFQEVRRTVMMRATQQAELLKEKRPTRFFSFFPSTPRARMR